MWTDFWPGFWPTFLSIEMPPRYLTGCLEPDCVLALSVRANSAESVIFFREKNSREERWEGPRSRGMSDGSLGRGRGRVEADTASQVSRGPDTGDQGGVMMAVRRGPGACVGSWNSDS